MSVILLTDNTFDHYHIFLFHGHLSKNCFKNGNQCTTIGLSVNVYFSRLPCIYHVPHFIIEGMGLVHSPAHSGGSSPRSPNVDFEVSEQDMALVSIPGMTNKRP